MSAIYMSQLSTTLPLMEGDLHQDLHHQGHFQAFTLPKDPPILFPFVVSSSSTSDSSLSYGSADHQFMRQQHQAMLEPQHMIGGSSSASVFSTPYPTVESIRDDMIEPSTYDPYDMGKLQVSGSLETGSRWTPPAKMRITRKASADPGTGATAGKKPRRKAAQAYEEMSSGMSSQPNLGVIRMCSDCNTTKTPLWRSGPCGPKSLCNACGIRQRKARRAMMDTGGAPSNDGAKVDMSRPSGGDAVPAHPKVKKEKRPDVDRSLPFKKRCKVMVQDHAATVAAVPATHDKAVFPFQQQAAAEEVVDAVPSRDLVDNIGLISWTRPGPPAPTAAGATACGSFWPPPAALPVQQDEITDAAMLLMTLSCGLVRS